MYYLFCILPLERSACKCTPQIVSRDHLHHHIPIRTVFCTVGTSSLVNGVTFVFHSGFQYQKLFPAYKHKSVLLPAWGINIYLISVTDFNVSEANYKIENVVRKL